MPTTKMTVLNHQPVPLEPLDDIDWSEGDVLYIGRRVMREGSEYDDGEEGEDVGWVVMDDYRCECYPFDLAERCTIFNFDHYDFEKTLARRLQSGETLLIEMTG